MKLNAGNNLLWPTNVYKTSISDNDCQELVSELMMTDALNSLVMDSESNLINKHPLLKKLATEKYGDFFRDVYGIDLDSMDYSFNAWLTGNKNGYSMDTHNHTGAQFVSVFYLLSEEMDSGGELVIQDPRFNANRGFTKQFRSEFDSLIHKPKTGDVLIFPGYVYHYVKQYTSQLRIAIPVDIFIKE